MKKYLFIIIFSLIAIVTGCSNYSINHSYSSNSILINEINLELVKCPAGSFKMGGTSELESIYKEELNKESFHKKIYGFDYSERLHTVTISKPFYIGKYEVTQKQYEAVMGINPSHFKSPDKPVEMVNWNEAKAFCDKLNINCKNYLPESYKFSLPTEAQWEYACRAGTNTLFNDGKSIYNSEPDELSWNEKNSKGSTQMVGKKKPNAWDIYDMHGNVWEWCNDWYGEYPNNDVKDSVGPNQGYFRVFRGGGWYSERGGCCSSYRRSNIPERKLICLGFRLALIPVELDENKNSKEEALSNKITSNKASGKTWKLKDLNLEMVECPAGNFIMGSPLLEYLDLRFEPVGGICEKGFGFLYNENQHLVNISKPFYIGKYEVTQKQYEKIMGENPSISKDESKPVDTVTWNNAKAFCQKLNSKYSDLLPKGYKFDLPTEAQWEYACRAGTTTALNNGKNLTSLEGKCINLAEVAWYGEKVEVMTHKVGQKKPNAWGIYDMHGNVAEWCNDFFGEYPNHGVTDPTGVTRCFIKSDEMAKKLGNSFMVIRGGCFCFPPIACRSGFRYLAPPDKNPNPTGKDDVFVGFRVALVPVISEYKSFMKNMIECPAGSFLMGSPINELGRLDEEKQHKVTITKPFFIGKYEVIQSQYETIMGNNPSHFKDNNKPVECVSYDDAKAFCNKLNEKFSKDIPKGYSFDLPTEAQWEYACRAGTYLGLNNNKNLTTSDGVCLNLNEVAWYNKNSDNITHQVGQKKPNAWGIYDMHGNVFEWCRDWYGDYIKKDINDPKGKKNGSDRVIRGGCCQFEAMYCRSACRSDSDPLVRHNSVGFRIALVPVEERVSKSLDGHSSDFSDIDSDDERELLTGFITVKSGAYIRKEPNTKSQSVGSLAYNTEVTILDTNGPKQTIDNITSNWFKVTDGKVFGWCFGAFVYIHEPNEIYNFYDGNLKFSIEMVLCPAGSFMMGSPVDEHKEVKKVIDSQCKFGETYNENLHLVTISKPFYIGKYEVTREQYEVIMGENPTQIKDYPNNYPVGFISWINAKKFCDKLNQKYLNNLPKGYKFDLPTEAQWEYACRAGTNSAYNNGKSVIYNDYNTNKIDTNLDEVCWYGANTKIPHLGGQKKPNAWGIYDMHGNLWEWCRDGYGEYPNHDVVDPFEKYGFLYNKTGLKDYVIRGGGYGATALDCRSASRCQEEPDKKLVLDTSKGLFDAYVFGFRVALVPVD